MKLFVFGASIALCSVSAVAAQPNGQQPLNLTRFGGGTANKYTYATGGGTTQVSGSIGTTPVEGTAHTNTSVMIPRQEGFSDQVDIRLFNGDDRIRLPTSIVAHFHGGNAGWFKLKDTENWTPIGRRELPSIGRAKSLEQAFHERGQDRFSKVDLASIFLDVVAESNVRSCDQRRVQALKDLGQRIIAALRETTT